MRVIPSDKMKHAREIKSDDLEKFGILVEKTQHERIYTPANVANATFYVKNGYVRLINQQKGISKIVGPGEFFGDRSMFYSKYICTEAITNVTYIQVDEPSFTRLMYNNTPLAFTIINSLSKHYIYLNEKKNLFSVWKEFFSHLRKGHSIKTFLYNWKIKKENCICWN